MWKEGLTETIKLRFQILFIPLRVDEAPEIRALEGNGFDFRYISDSNFSVFFQNAKHFPLNEKKCFKQNFSVNLIFKFLSDFASIFKKDAFRASTDS